MSFGAKKIDIFAESSRQREHRTSNYASEDYIGNMPHNVITNILKCLPLKEAVRTDTLARNWRFKWNLLTDVIVDEDFFYFLTNKFDGKHISRRLLQLKGPIRRFVLSIEPKMLCGQVGLNYEDIRDWLLFLSREGIEELTIRNWYGEPVTLPTQLYSRKELKHLELHYCTFPTLECLCSFPNLLSLELLSVTFLSGTFLEFIARCPLLEFVKLNVATTNEMRLSEIAQLRNIKKLHLSFGVWNQATTITTSNVFHLASLPKLETLTLVFQDCKLLAEANSNKNVPVAFVSLMSLNLSGVDFGNNFMVSFIIEMIRGSPILQRLETRASIELSVVPLELSALDLDSNTIGPRQLQSVVFQSFPRSENELTIIKFILAFSPFLKKIYILVSNLSHDESENIKMNGELTRKLLKLHRASRTSRVDFF